MGKQEESHIITVNIDNERYQYLQRNPGINRSKIFRDKVDEIRYGQLFYFDYQLFIMKIIVIFTVCFLLFFLLPIYLIPFLPFIFALLSLYILLDAIVIISKHQERRKDAKPNKGNRRY